MTGIVLDYGSDAPDCWDRPRYQEESRLFLMFKAAPFKLIWLLLIIGVVLDC